MRPQVRDQDIEGREPPEAPEHPQHQRLRAPPPPRRRPPRRRRDPRDESVDTVVEFEL